MKCIICAPWRSGTHLIKQIEKHPDINMRFEPGWKTVEQFETWIKNKDAEVTVQAKRGAFFAEELLKKHKNLKVIHLERSKDDWVHSFMNRSPTKVSKPYSMSTSKDYMWLKNQKQVNEFFDRPWKTWLEDAWKHFQEPLWKLEKSKHRRVMRITYEEMCTNPKESSKKICEFLEVEVQDDLFKTAHKNSIWRSKK